MKIDTSLIEGYENLSAEEKVEALLNLELEDTETKRKYKDLVDKAASDAKKQKDKAREEERKRLEAEEKLNSRLSEEEKAQQEQEERIKAIEEENARLKRNAIVAKKTAFYQNLGYSPELAQETAEAFADGDFDTVDKNQMTAHEEFEKTIRADVVRNNPHPQNNGGAGGARLSLAEAMMRANQGEEVEVPTYKK